MKVSTLSTLMVATGIILTISSLSVFVYKNYTLPKQSKTDLLTFANSTSPVRLTIQSAGIDVPVKKAENYQFSDHEAIFINTSQAIGTGNSVIYAHNWHSLFGKLGKAKVGETITVFLTDGRQYQYQVTQIHTVSPQTLAILKPTTDSRLTLFTCTGFLDKDRLVVVAKQI